jgi:ferric-chelate reductase
VCCHTPFASPWIYPPLTFYGLDLFLRLLRFRFKLATLSASDTQLTHIHIERCDSGWVAGQHIRLRVFLGAKVFESHPLSICNAPSDITTITSSRGEMLLGARTVGDWTRTLNGFARANESNEDEGEEKKVMVMIDGPYGGISFDLGRYDNVFLVAGGAGVTFTIGVLDDLVGRIIRRGRRDGERTTKIQFVWCIKSFGTSVSMYRCEPLTTSLHRLHSMVWPSIRRNSARCRSRPIIGTPHEVLRHLSM